MTQSKTLTASCHCGAVTMEALVEPPSITECNCSICRRYGAKWAYFTNRTVRLNTAPDSVTAYSWGDHDIEFFHCSTCGCMTHYESTDKSGEWRVAINTRMMDPAVINRLPVRYFDGASSWTFLNE